MVATVISGNQVIPLRDDSRQGANEQRLTMPIPDLDFSASNDYIIDISFQVAGLTFSNPRTMFVDNTTNPAGIAVSIGGTQQKFTIPPFTAGYFIISAQVSSRIEMVSTGPATGPIHVQLYNYGIPPVTWSLGSTSVVVVGTVDENLKQINGVTVSTGHGVANTGTLRVELPTDGTGKVGLNAGAAVIGQVGIDQTTPGTTNRTQDNIDLIGGAALSLGVKAATQSIPVVEATSIPLGFQQITPIAAATALTVPAGSKFAVLNVQAQAVRWRDDGINPTTTVGMLLSVGSVFTYDGDLTAIQFIEVVAGAELNVSYYG